MPITEKVCMIEEGEVVVLLQESSIFLVKIVHLSTLRLPPRQCGMHLLSHCSSLVQILIPLSQASSVQAVPKTNLLNSPIYLKGASATNSSEFRNKSSN